MDISTYTAIGQTLHDPEVTIAFGAILAGFIKIAVIAVAGLAGRLINTKFNVENSTWKQKLAYRLVCYAQNQIAGDTEKQAYVSKQLASLLGKRVKAEEVQHLLEEAVVKLTSTMKGKPA